MTVQDLINHLHTLNPNMPICINSSMGGICVVANNPQELPIHITRQINAGGELEEDSSGAQHLTFETT